MKEYIEIKDKNGKLKKAKVNLRFHDEKSNKNYIVYEYNNENYAAKYEDIVGESKLDTNLTSKEIEVLEKVLNTMEKKDEKDFS